MPAVAAGLEDRRAGRRPRRSRRRSSARRARRRGAPGAIGTRRRAGRRLERDAADVELDAHSGHQLGAEARSRSPTTPVWPRPQIDASRIAWPISRRRPSSVAADPRGVPAARRASSSSWRTVPDPARDALAARLVAEERGDPAQDVDEVGRAVEDHDDARAEARADGPGPLERERRVERVGPDERRRRRRRAGSSGSPRPPRTPPARSMSSRRVVPNGTS